MAEAPKPPQGPHQQPWSPERVIPDDEVAQARPITPEIGHRIAAIIRVAKGPTRDKLTNKYNFRPTASGAKEYATVARDRTLKRVAHGRTEAKELINDRKGLRFIIARDIQRTSLFNLTVSLFRAEMTSSALDAVYNGEDLPHDAALHTADAIEDFGFCVIESGGFRARVGDSEGMGAGLIKLGREMVENPDLIRDHLELVSAVGIVEQGKRCEFWRPRLLAANEAFGNQLTGPETEQERELGFDV
jgi:hypothetical protein